MQTPPIVTHECGAQLHAGVTAVRINNREQAPSIATVSKRQGKSLCQHFSNASFQAVN